MEQKQPDCFGWADGYNPSCKRCIVFKDCMEKQAHSRPRCFGNPGLYDPDSVNCSRCLDQSFCVEAIGGEKMTVNIKRPAMTLRPGNRTAPVKREEEEIVGEVAEELEVPTPAPSKPVVRPAATVDFGDISDSAYFNTSIVDLRKMAEERGMDPTGRKSDVIKRLIQADLTGHVAPPKKQEDLAVLPKPGEVQRLVVEAATWASEMLERLRRGETLLIIRTDNGYEVALTNVKSRAVKEEHRVAEVVNQEKVTEAQRNEATFTPEYYRLRYVDSGYEGKSWNTMTHDEKKAYASELGVEYEQNDNVPIEAMRILAAVREKLGIEMYRPEYQKKSARVAAGYW